MLCETLAHAKKLCADVSGAVSAERLTGCTSSPGTLAKIGFGTPENEPSKVAFQRLSKAGSIARARDQNSAPRLRRNLSEVKACEKALAIRRAAKLLETQVRAASTYAAHGRVLVSFLAVLGQLLPFGSGISL